MNKNNIIICLGGGKKQFPLIKASLDLGFEIVLIDRDPYPLCQDKCFKTIKCSTHDSEKVIFELKPSDWELIFKHTGWEINYKNIFLQYPKKNPLRLLKSSWKKYDFEGFYGAILKRNSTWTDKYLDW